MVFDEFMQSDELTVELDGDEEGEEETEGAEGEVGSDLFGDDEDEEEM